MNNFNWLSPSDAPKIKMARGIRTSLNNYQSVYHSNSLEDQTSSPQPFHSDSRELDSLTPNHFGGQSSLRSEQAYSPQTQSQQVFFVEPSFHPSFDGWQKRVDVTDTKDSLTSASDQREQSRKAKAAELSRLSRGV